MFNIVAIYKDWSLNKKIFETYRSNKTGNLTIDPLNEVPKDQLEKEQGSAGTVVHVFVRIWGSRYVPVRDLVGNGLEHGCSLNFEKELDRLISLKIIGQRYSFLFEDVWFILIQYLYFEKFIVSNSITRHEKWSVNWRWIFLDSDFVLFIMENFGFMCFNLIFTAFVGLGGLTTTRFCLKMIKQGKTKAKLFYILTFIQILLQTIFPFIRAYLVIYNVIKQWDIIYFKLNPIKNCALVGFQVYSFPIQPFDWNRLKINEA